MPQRSFAHTVLPWLVGAVMLIVYLITLDKVVTVQCVMPLARAAGADWHPVYTSPLSWLITLPVRWLPSGAKLIGLNFTAALCAAISLTLLARCVSILPHNRTPFQRANLIPGNSLLNIRLAWVPALFAVLMCGLQRTFWEHAIIGTGEMIDLLLFAYCVRCLLEFRLNEKNAWLYKLALVYGMGITNNFAMIGFFPVLLASLLWIKRLQFFRLQFLLRMLLFAVAGLSLYLLLPFVQMQSDVQPVTFWQALKANLVFQKQHVFSFPRWRVGWIAAYALLPLLLAGIRWPDTFDDTSSLGRNLTLLFAVILHAGCLALCLYIAFDPPPSPRQFGLGLPFLPAYFLGSLSVGYFSGFLLLVFHEWRDRRPMPIRFGLPPFLNYTVTALVCAVAILLVGRLVAQNGMKIRELISPTMHRYAAALAESLPEKGAVVLSDDPLRLHAVDAVLGFTASRTHLLIDTTSWGSPAYHTFLRNRYGGRWPQLRSGTGAAGIPPQQIVELLSELSKSCELIYLHPSFGLCFENFYQQPRKLAYLLKSHPANAIAVPPPSPELITEQTVAWANLLPEVNRLKATAALPSGGENPASRGSTHVAAYYSHAINWWGVELQRAVRFDEAAKFFDEAIALNPDNASALINQEANAAWRTSGKPLAKTGKHSEEKLQLYRGVNELLSACGPVDHPEFLLQVANMLMQKGFYRQAGQMLQRAIAFAPDELAYRVAFANVTLLSLQPDRALALIYALGPRVAQGTPALQIELARVEGLAHYARDNFAKAESTLQRTVERFPQHAASYTALSQLYIIYANKFREQSNLSAAATQLTNALKVLDTQLKTQPDSPDAHFQQGTLLLALNDYERAAVAFSKVMELQKDNSTALLNRAVVRLRSNRLDEAERDYQTLLRQFTPNYRVYYGLGEIAYRRENWKEARTHYKDYLRGAHGASAEEIHLVRTRLAELKKK